jgi:hypothetical protein
MGEAVVEMDQGGALRTLKDLFAGAAGGVAQVLLGTDSIHLYLSWVVVHPIFRSRASDRSGCYLWQHLLRLEVDINWPCVWQKASYRAVQIRMTKLT